MRKDIFIVGARLLGIWQLLGAASLIAQYISIWAGLYKPSVSYQESYAFVHMAVELVTGLYLIFSAYPLYDILNKVKEAAAPDEPEDIEEAK